MEGLQSQMISFQMGFIDSLVFIIIYSVYVTTEMFHVMMNKKLDYKI